MHPIEYASARDIFYDFCLWEYKPVAAFEKKFRSVNLLRHSFEAAGADARLFDLVRAIRDGIGDARTVWGIKRLDQTIKWEFYFYDYGRKDRERSATKVLDIIRPFIACNVEVNENLPYFMFSLDISEELVSGERELEEIHLYIGNPGSTVSSGICYSLTRTGTKLENFYFFFDAKREADEILSKAACSSFIDSRIDLGQIFWPEMRGSRVVVVANKQQNDSVYFSGIDVAQLIFFLKKLQYPAALISFVEDNRNSLDHMLYDVGFDYRMENGQLKILKSGYYGVF